MKKAIAVIIIPMLILSFSGLNSCRNKAEKAKTGEKDLEIEQVQTLEQEIEKNVYPLPTSAEVIKMLSELEVGYIMGIANPVANARKYLTSSAKAINMGVFGADLSYATLYNIQQEVLNYLDAIRSLSNELNMSQIYDENLYDRIRKNFDNREELVNILTEAFDKTYAYLAENDQQSLALLVVGGAWVEGMYLTTHVSEAAYQVAGISRVLIEQKESFDLFVELTEPYLTDQNVKEFVDRLEPIKKVYEGLTTSLTNQNIIDITKAIETIRGQII
ncbi:MAG: hypothetical protein RBS38_00535 [Bacteroidales bacterium]|jgi:hypothetical protein|nr:hypothetical protein [Bacteroidales bacterium]